MAYVVSISKESVNKMSDTEFYVSVHVIITEDSNTILDKTYSKRYTSGESLNIVKAVLLKQIQDDWDKLQSELALMNNIAFDALCSDMQTTAETYIN